MSDTIITTNNKPRDIIDAWELTASELAEFDLLYLPAIEDGRDSASFVRYCGQAIPLSDFSAYWGITRGTGLPAVFKGWHGYLSDSYSSGLVIRYTDDTCESVVIGRFTT